MPLNNKHKELILIEVIKTMIATTTDFLSKFYFLQDNSKRNTNEYKKQLSEWNLFSELQLIENNATIQQNLFQKLIKIYNKMPFDTKGNYNWERYYVLKDYASSRQTVELRPEIDEYFAKFNEKQK